MSQVLYITATPKPVSSSRTLQVSDYFIKEYKKENPHDEVIHLDLYQEDIHPLNNDDLKVLFGSKDDSSQNHPVLKYVYQFAKADKYVIGAPMWNLSFPAILKVYFDYVNVIGVTAQYTTEGAVGLLKGKKAIYITSRGGIYTGTDLDLGEKYVQQILGFFGIDDVQTLPIEGVDIKGADVQQIVENAKKMALNIIKEF